VDSIKKKWQSLALYKRITIIMVFVLLVGLLISAILSCFIFGKIISDNFDQQVQKQFAAFDFFGGIYVYTIKPMLSIEFMHNVKAEIFKSFISYFICSTIGIVILGGLVSFFTMRKTIKRVENEHQKTMNLIQNISHDLRTPLAVIKGYAQFLKIKNENKISEVEKIEESSDRIEALLEDMLILARNDNSYNGNPIKIETNLVDIKDILETEIKTFERLNPDYKFEFDCTYSNVLIKTNIEMFKRIVENIITNSIKYTDSNTLIKVSLRNQNENVQIVFSDTGDGIDKENLNNIFDRFIKLDQSRSKSGSGLGLAIVKEFVYNLKGTVKAFPTDKTTGKGLSIQIILPKNSKKL
jgi:signal transduction histidine kinase